MHPLPIVSFILGSFLFCACALVGLIVVDRLVERRLNQPLSEPLQLSLESLIGELTVYA
jgi:hypothetical protein